MRIAIFGTGGAGGYFGAQLARAGEDVVFIARGEHLRAIRSHGLRLQRPDGEIIVKSPATDDPSDVGPVDVVLVGVKTWQLADAASAMRPMIAARTFVVPMQNGVEAAGQLSAVLGREHVVDGVCGTISWVVAPGQVRSVGETNFIKFGEQDNRQSERVDALRQTFERAHVDVEVPLNIESVVWRKFIFVTPYGGVSAVTRVPAGVIRSLPETRSMVNTGMEEILAIANARNILLPDGVVEKSMALLDRLDPNATPSLQRDIIAGKPSELDAWTGAVVRLGRESNVPTPLHDYLYSSLLPLELRAREARLVAEGDKH